MKSDIKDIKELELIKDKAGIPAGTKLSRDGNKFVAVIKQSYEGDGYTYKTVETRTYSEGVIEQSISDFRVVEYTEEYINRLAEESKELVYKPFKPRKTIRKQIAEYEKQLAALEAGETKFYSDSDKHEARTVWFNLIKALKWVINEDEQVCKDSKNI